jgi:predicted transcriptional regulator
MTRKLHEIIADIIEAQGPFEHMSLDSLEQTLSALLVSFQRMKKAEDCEFLLEQARPLEEAVQEEVPEMMIDAKESIQEDKVICLECQAEMRQMTVRHLNSHGLTIREYKRKWGLPQRQPLSAKSLTKARSEAAKKRRLPEKLMQFQEERKR